MSEGRVSLITGGARGIGLGIARRFSRAGDRVVIADILEAEGCAAADEVCGVFCPLDVSDEKAVSDCIADVESTVGPIEVLVNSAGILQKSSAASSMPLDEHDRVWRINYRGTYLCCRFVSPGMAQRGSGVILNLASINSFRAYPLPAYTPGKAAIKSLTEILAAELGPKGVRVNAVAPGFTLTPGLQERIDAGERDPEKILSTTALGRFVAPEDVAEASYFLCSGKAAAITGVCLPVDCGWLAAVTYRSYPV